MQSVSFQTTDGIQIEGVLQSVPGAPGAVLTHPHPLYGGDMDNPAVTSLEASFRTKGFSTLRFNFRGVGNSGGRYADGKGEIEDVCAAADYLRSQGVEQITLAGYSFGAWVNGHAAENARVDRIIMISPPVAMMDFSAIAELPRLTLVITGENDDIAPPAKIREYLDRWNPEAVLEVISGGDHFYGNTLTVLTSIIENEIG